MIFSKTILLHNFITRRIKNNKTVKEDKWKKCFCTQLKMLLIG